MTDKFVLDENNTPIPVSDVLTWGKWFCENRERRKVARDEIDNKIISTVFLGLNHSFGKGPPLLYETMVFDQEGYEDLYCQRYSTWDEALIGHSIVVQMVKDGLLG